MTTQKIVKQEIVGEYNFIQTAVQDYVTIDGIETPVGPLKRLRVIAPGDDTSDMPAQVQALAASLHTPELIAAYGAKDAEPTLEQVKADKLKQIAAQRYSIETAGVSYVEDDVTYIIRSDRDDVSRLKETVDEIIDGTIISQTDWKCKNEIWLNINQSNVMAIKIAVLSHLAACFAAEKQAQADIATLETIEEVQAYEFSIG